jgi:hypothetical protein
MQATKNSIAILLNDWLINNTGSSCAINEKHNNSNPAARSTEILLDKR